METIIVNISGTDYKVRITNNQDTTFTLDMINNHGMFTGGVVIDREECHKIATALLAAAGEPGATSKIVSNRAVIRPHVFEIGDDVETNDGIRGYIEDFQDATVIIRTDNELLVQRGIADIEYIGDERPSVDEVSK